MANIDHPVFDEDLTFTFGGSLWLSFHTFVISLSTHIDQLSVELVCGQLLQEELWCEQEVQFNHGPKHDALIIKHVFGKLKKVVNWKKFKNEKQKKKGTCYNCGTKRHFVKECHEKK